MLISAVQRCFYAIVPFSIENLHKEKATGACDIFFYIYYNKI